MYGQKTVSTGTTSNVADALLAKQVIAGDNVAFEVLVKRYSTALFNYIYRFMGEHEEASDILQEVFLRFYMALPSLECEKPLKPWLFQVAHNCCIDELRQRRKHVLHFSQIESENTENDISVLDELPDTSPSIEEVIAQRDIQHVLQKAILSLPLKFRAVVALRYTSNLRFAEIGRILGMPEQTTKTYFHRAKTLLRQRLEKETL